MTNTVVNESEWLEARTALLEKEKQLARARDEVAAARRALPWRLIEEDYTFEGPSGSCSFADLFDGRSQLIVHHFMYGPGWQEGCKSCSFWADQYDGIMPHLNQRDASLVCISRAPWQDFADFRARMGWQFNWVSSAGSSFNQDFNVSFDQPGEGFYNYRTTGVGEEMPGYSVFCRDESGSIYHTYSCYSRGLDPMNATYQMLDLLPKGRDEADLPFPMAWVNHHDRYE